MSSYISNSFSVSVNRPTTGTIEPVSTVNIYKNEKMLQAVSGTKGGNSNMEAGVDAGRSVGIRAWAFATRLNDISRNNIIFLKVILS